MRYEMALEVVRSAESALVGQRPQPPYRWMQTVADTVLGGPGLIIAGGHILLNRIAWVVVTAAIFAVFLGTVDGQRLSSTLLPSLFLAMGVVYFSTPQSFHGRWRECRPGGAGPPIHPLHGTRPPAASASQ